MKRLVLLALCLTTACGYHVAGKADLVPKTIKTIAIPALGNGTTFQKLPVLLTFDITREFLSRTRYNIVADPNHADAVLTGALVNLTNYPVVSDPDSGRATGVQLIAVLQLTLTDRSTGKVLFSRSGAEFRERYEISTNPQAYFDESGTAIRRVSRDIARSVVSAILENF
jgi:outer membrane lipopolysaccharide assembly protein LptE/RlpB